MLKTQFYGLGSGFFLLFLKIFIYLFIWLHWVLVAACNLQCSMRDLVPWPGIEPRPPALGAQSLCHWTTREVPRQLFLKMTQKAQATKKKHKLHLIEIKHFCLLRDTTKKVKDKPQTGNTIKIISNKELEFRIFKNSCNSMIRKYLNEKKGQRLWKEILPKKMNK